jgi:PDZ domain
MTTQLKPAQIVLPALCILAFALGTAHAKDPDLLSLGVNHFRDTATVTDNPLDAVVTVSTENGYQEHHGPMRTVWNDEFLEGVIDKKTGQKSFLAHVWITYIGGPRSYRIVRYQVPEGPRSVPATQTALEKSLCAVGDCTYTEHLSFPVDESTLRRLAAQTASGKQSLWPFKAVAKSGPDYSGGFSNAEIAGLLAKVDDYGHDVPPAAAAGGTAAPALAGMASLKQQFGVGGMPVAATADQPDRAGVLIIAVGGGSVAQKAGLIVGDIVYEFGGRSVRTPAELQAAVADCAANATVAVKLFRGTAAMAVSARF